MGRLTPLTVDFEKTTLWHFLILSAAAYVTGLIIDPIAKNLWFNRFGKRKSQIEIVSSLNAGNDSVVFSDEKFSWGILTNYIKLNSPDISRDIQRMNALCIMLRNVSFALFILSLLLIGNILVFGFSVGQVFIALISFMGSGLSLKQAATFDEWHYQRIYQAIAALEIKPENFPVKFVPNKHEPQMETSSKENVTKE